MRYKIKLFKWCVKDIFLFIFFPKWGMFNEVEDDFSRLLKLRRSRAERKILEGSFFPIRIKIADNSKSFMYKPGQEYICESPEYVPYGVPFTVLETRVLEKHNEVPKIR